MRLAHDTFELMVGNAIKAAEGKETNIWGATLRKFGEKYMPGSNVWSSRLVVQRLIWNNLIRLLDSNPEDYFQRQED